MKFIYEDHEEFCTFSFFRESDENAEDALATRESDENAEDALSSPPIGLVPSEWLSAMPGRVVLAVNLVAEDSDIDAGASTAHLSRMFNFNSVMAATMNSRMFTMFTDYRIHQDGFTRIVLQSHRSEAHTNSSSGREKTGRIIKRMLDVECYRLLALLALPLALQMKAPMHQLETRMRELVKDLDAMGAVSGRPADVTQDRRMLEEIIQLSSEAEKISAAISPRFSAAQAYFNIVQDRIEFLGLGQREPFPRCDQFILQRLKPAMVTLQSTAARLETCMVSLQRAADLLRTRVEINQEQQNVQLLEQMARRSEMQVKLQQTVEGLSVGPVTYYTLGVLGYGLKGMASQGWMPVSVEAALGVAMPAVALAVWFGLQRMHKKLHNDTH
eukprot:CAMPEP_0177776986 /NCGR_PEP_ID=MMETSP0491_2-20121128/15029_1 /TAXON_ID=63592 /ORGANISM="Tetraselmis chuii, Strain PLY429" /LENGTH=385 /DNA_ID=CAMNT_0019295861 /DNA_START=1 /DNA_END=1159 /DNA_ORIENTATION=-